MSNAGQAILGVVGAVVGFYVGGPQGAVYGAQLGLLAGSALFPTQLPAMVGPRLGDGQRTLSQVGAPIPWTHGTQTVGGIIIWASPIREVSTTQTAGKGGSEQSQTTYTYYRSFAILLCEGPIQGVRRIWANGKLILDRSSLPGHDWDEILEDMSSALAQGIVGREAINDELISKMTIYLGTEDQMPDPVIESFEGSGNVPAYRGYAYAVFDDIELKPEDGNRMPASWKFEVYEDGELTVTEGLYFSNEELYEWNAGIGADPRNARNYHEYVYTTPGSGSASQAPGDPDPIPEMIDDAKVASGYDRTLLVGSAVHVNGSGTRQHIDTVGQSAAAAKQQTSTLEMHFNRQLPDYWVQEDETPPNCPNYPAPGTYWYTDGAFGSDLNYASGQTSVSDPTLPGWETRTTGCLPQQWIIYSLEAFKIRVQRLPAAPQNPAEVGTLIEGTNRYLVDGVIMPDAEWVYDDSKNYRVLQEFDGGYASPGIPTDYPLNPALPVGHSNDNEAFWTAAYLSAVAEGKIEPGLVYGVDYPKTQSFGYVLDTGVSIITTNPISIATIVSRICNRCAERFGASFLFDVSDLEDRYVIGYQLSRPMAGRGAIETLRPVGFFDAIESGVQLKFPVRGKEAVATISDDELGAYFVDESRPSKVTTSKALELELPRQIRVHYQDPDREYDPGEQLSPARFDTKAESVADLDLGVAITADDAAKCAEVAYRDAWASRWTHSTQLDVSRSNLEPTDCVIVSIDGSNERVRIPRLAEKPPNLRMLEMIRDDDSTYVSTASGTTVFRTPSSLALYGPVAMELLDLPPLSNAQTTPCLYVGFYPQIIDGAFRGAVLQRSADGGGTFQTVSSATQITTVGTVLTPADDGPSQIMDVESELVVQLVSGTAGDATEQELLNGANAAAVGVHGRWEILQWLDAELIATRTYRLTGLLRGRLGTEWAIGTGMAGDKFVVLEHVATVPISVPEVGANLLYKATQVGMPQAAAMTSLIARNATLKPFSPVHVAGEWNGADLVITWVRRDRLADPLGTESDVPLSEGIEDYEVDILDSDGEVRRTISSSVELATYTEQMQVQDFGIAQTIGAVRVVVYQNSVQVGRGYGSEAATL